MVTSLIVNILII